MSTFFNAPTQAIGGGGLSSREGKRNKKAQALSALLSASALGLFLEGCGSSGPSASTPGGGGGGGSQTLVTGTAGFDRYNVASGSNVRIEDADTSGSATVANPNGVYFDTNHRGTVYTSNSFTLTRSGDNLIIDVASLGERTAFIDPDITDGRFESVTVTVPAQDSSRVEIVDYFLRPSSFEFFFNGSDEAFAFNPASFLEITVPSNLAAANALAASVAALSDSDADSVTLLVGSEGDEELLGSEGNDILQGRGGADTLNGGEGADTLFGGTGADTYVFGEGDGADTIVEVAEEGVVNTLKFEGDYEVSDFSFARSSEDGTDLVIVADTDGDGQAENEVTLKGYFVSETSIETVYSIELQINDEEAFVPSLEG